LETKWFTVGKIVNTHGIRGDVKIHSQTDFPEDRFKPGGSLTLWHPELGKSSDIKIEASRLHKNTWIVKVKGWNDINEVEKYKGWLLKVNDQQLFELPEDEYYYHEIIGCSVVTDDGQALGTITEILSPGANDVWVVQSAEGKPVYIPYIDDVVKIIDVPNKKVTIELLEGLI
jgi:16S rRNA processing protein RimM